MLKLLSIFLLFALVSCGSMAYRSTASASEPKRCAQLLAMMSNELTYNNYSGSYDIFAEELELFKANPDDPTRLIETNNITIKYLKELLDGSGMEFRIEKTTYTYKGERFEYDQLLVPPQTDRPALVDRLSKGLNVKGVYLEQIGNNLSGFSGYYTSSTRTISLRMKHLEGIVSDNISETLKHEFSHAQFESLRLRGRRSIYSNKYYSSTSKKLTNDAYSDYMSAEELYNYVGGPYWYLQAKDVYNDNAKHIVNDLERIRTSLRAAESHPLQIETLTNEFISTIGQLKKERTSLASIKVEIKDDHIQIYDSEYRQLHSFIDDEKRALADRYMSALESYNKYDDAYDGTEKLLTNIADPQVAWRLKDTWNGIKKIGSDVAKKIEAEKELKLALMELLGEIEKEQRILNKVAKEIQPQVKKCQDLVQAILDDPDSKELFARFDAIRGELRSLANMPREHFEGFVGRLSADQDIAVEVKSLSPFKRVIDSFRQTFNRK